MFLPVAPPTVSAAVLPVGSQPPAVFVIGFPGNVLERCVSANREANPHVPPGLITSHRIRCLFGGTNLRVCSVGPCRELEGTLLGHHKAGTLPGMAGSGVFVMQAGELRLLGIRTVGGVSR